MRKILVTIACAWLGLMILISVNAAFEEFAKFAARQEGSFETGIQYLVFVPIAIILAFKLWKYRRGQIRPIRKYPILWAIPGAIALCLAVSFVYVGAKELLLCGLVALVQRQMAPEQCLGFAFDSVFAVIALLLGKWMWPYQWLGRGSSGDTSEEIKRR